MTTIAKCSIVVLVLCLVLSGCASANNTEQTLPVESVTPNLENVETTPSTQDKEDPDIPGDAEIQDTTVETITPPNATEVLDVTETTTAPQEPQIPPLDTLSDDDMVRILDYIPNAIVDLKYATTDNFTGKQIYDSNIEAMLRVGTLKKLVLVQEELWDRGYTLVIWDAYRPLSAQFKLWEVCPNPTYVANPNNGGSSHNCGNTIDVTVATRDGVHAVMPTIFDEFSKLADRDYSDVSQEAADNSILLETVMRECGFKPYYNEWWHFSDTDSYPVYYETNLAG